MKSESHFFKSCRFSADPTEDQETNPGCYGRQLADWMMQRLRERNWTPVEVIPEDWGRCLIIHYKPYLLWVACSNVRANANVNPEYRDGCHGSIPAEIIWSTFAGRDLYPWNANFWRRSKADEEFDRLKADLRNILNEDPTIEFVDH